jgi:methyltransferase (TIGR00027 family)
MTADRMVIGLLAATTLRVAESYRPEGERILEDRFGRDFLPPVWRLLLLPGVRHALIVVTERRGPGALGMLLCRTRYIDDALRNALGEGLDQVVNLGVGFDTRAYRIAGIDQTRVFEVDQPALLAWKQARLQQVLGTPPRHVTFVPIDFNEQRLEDTLAAAGFRTGVKTFFIWEGVTQYITAEAVDSVLRYVSRVAAPGSQIVFTYIQRGIIDGSARSETDEIFLSATQGGGMPWIFGFDPAELAGYLAARGLTLLDHAGALEYRARYLEPLGRQMNVYEGERMALAQVAGG